MGLTKYAIRRRNTQYAMHTQLYKYAIRIRNTQYAMGLTHQIRNTHRNTQYAVTHQQIRNTQCNTQYAVGPPSRYAIRIINTASSPPQEHSIRNTNTTRNCSHRCCRTLIMHRYAKRNGNSPHSPRQVLDTQCAIRNMQPAPGGRAESQIKKKYAAS